MNHAPHSRTRIGLLGLLVLASCFHAPSVTPSASLGPAGPDSEAARTKGPFAVVYAAPRGHVADRKQPGVTVLFSRGVRSVDMADDERVPPVVITSKSAGPVKGTWRWTGTRGLLFTPEGELPGGSDFVVTVPAGTKSLDGAALERPYTLELDTDGPVVSSLTVLGPPGITERAMPSDPAFRVQFDQSVDPNAVLAAASLRVFAGDGDRGENVRLLASREGAPRLTPSLPASYVVVLKPEKPLPLDHQVALSIASTLRGTGGPRPMSAPYLRTMRTHGPLRFVDFYCPRIESRGRCRAGGDVRVVLSNPVAPEELRSHAVLAKLPPRVPAKGEKRRIDPATEHWLGVAPKLGEEYKVTLTAGMRDVYGQKLDKDASFDLVTEAPLVKPPVVDKPAAPAPAAPPPQYRYKKGPPPVAAGADTRPRREKLPYRLDLGLVGQVLEANAGQHAHRIPVGAINIPTYTSLAAPLTDAQATSWALGDTADFLGRNGFVPSWKSTQAAENERAVDFLDLDAVLASRHGRGPALLVITPPGTREGGTESFVTLTDLGVSAKMSPYGGLVWVTQLSTGKPVAGASVSIRTAKGGEVFQATSDATGVVAVPADRFDPLGGRPDGAAIRTDAAIVVRAGDDWTIAKIARSPVETRLTSQFEVLSKEGRWAGMLFADRGVFRPGETAKVSGIVRVIENEGLRSIAGRELRIELKDRNNEQIFDGRAKCDDFGTFAVDLPIPKTAELGPATITATAPPGGRSNTSEPGVFTHSIRLLAFKPNEFKVEAEPDKPSYVRGDDAEFSAQGDYLYGAPMPGASVTTTVSRQEVSFDPPGTEGFTTTDDVFTGDYPDATKEAEQVDSQDGTLDEHGGFKRKIQLAFKDQRRPERVVFDAEVQDLSRRTVSARASVIVHPGEIYAALRTPIDRFVAAGTAFRSEVAAVEPSGAHRAGVRVKVELVERRWNGVVGEQPDGTPMRSSNAQDTVLGSCNLVTTAKTTTCDLQVPHAGYFVVRATASDPRGNTVRSSTSIYGTEDSPRTQTAWASDDRHGMKLEANKAKFDIGETAKVLLRSPFKEGQALVTVERNGVLWRKVVPIKGPLPVVEVPIRPEFYPNAFVSVVALRGRILAPPASGADVGSPDYRFGYAELRVNQEAHRLNVAVGGSRTEYHPGETVDEDVVVTDRAGKPVESSLTFYVVDEGVLALTSYKTPDPLPAFVEPRKLAVFTFDNRELLAHILAMQAGEHVAPLGYEYALSGTGANYDKGDDGGDGGNKRADFRTTAFFEAGKKTDREGKAHFKFKLPDNLTTFRVMAVAAAVDDRFGSGESKLTTFRKLMARPALPRFVRVGDALEASVIVSSKAEDGAPAAKMNVDVTLDVKGLTSTGPKTRTVTMTRGGQAEVRFPVKATLAGEAVISFEARSGKDVDRVEMKRQVELPVSRESAVVYGETSGASAISLKELATLRKDYGGLDVRMAPSALVGLGATIDRLTDYPYGCTEQVTSRTLPLVAALDLAKDVNARLPADVNASIDGAIEQILKRQNYDGGFGFWDKSESEPWLSAYAMLAVSGAATAKRFVPKDAIERGRDYLTMTLATLARRFGKSESDEPVAKADAGAQEIAAEKEKEETSKAIDFASATLVGDTLATLGWQNPGALNVLYDARAGQRLFATASLLHAMAKSDMSSAQIKTLSHEVEQRLRVGPNEVDVDEEDTNRYAPLLDSHARTLAIVLRALLAADPHHPLAARMARRLLTLRQNGAWRTTQEDAWALLALADYKKTQEARSSAFEARAFLGNGDLLKSAFPQGSTREDKVFVAAAALDPSARSLTFEVHGEGRVFYAAELKYATSALPSRPRDEGLFVQKYVRGVAPTDVTEALESIPKRTQDAVSAGDLVIVDLLFESAEPREHIVLDDPLPAGLEALDFELDTTSQAQRDAEAKAPADPKAAWLGTTYRSAASHREVRDDRVITFFKHVEPGMYRVHYLARATSIGSFVVPPTRIEAMYAPEVYGRTAASAIAVRPKP